MKRVGTDCWETRWIVFLFIGGIPISGCHGEATLRYENVGDTAVERRESAENVESQGGEQNEAYSIRIGQLEFGVLFENHKISKALKDLIVREIELIYSQLENIYTSELRAGARKYRIDGDLILSKHIIYRGAQDLYLPKAISDSNFGDLLRIDSRFFLIVSKKLIERYLGAYDFLKDNSEAFSELLEFIAAINNLEKAEILSDSKVTEMFFLSDPRMRTSANVSMFRSNLESLLDYKIEQPSILDFQILDVDGDSLLFCTVLLKKESSPKVADQIGVGKVGNHWRLVF